MQHVSNLAGKSVAGGAGAVAAVTEPSKYISYFDRVYDIGFLISGDDISRVIGMVVGVLVATNILYTLVKDFRERRERKRNEFNS